MRTAFYAYGLFGIVFLCVLMVSWPAAAEPTRSIVIDGSFGDWAGLPLRTDPVDDQHDTDHTGPADVPAYVDHPDADLLEFTFAHDEETLYAYFKSRGTIGRTQAETPELRAGRYYGIVTIDVDNNDTTGYWLHEGGYYPTSPGYDMNMEIEWYNGEFNTGHYLNHGARDQEELDQAFVDQANGIVRVLPGTYDYYTQWVMFENGSIVWVLDRGPVYQGIITVAISPDGHEMEMAAPFRGFMKDPEGNPIVALGKTLDVSFSLEASSELAPGAEWASDTADPIVGYYLGGATDKAADVDKDGKVDATDVQTVINGALGITVENNSDISRDGETDAVDVQMVINAVLAGG
ncbi:MAG: dockerin type I domain-containing protein [FCB group bacterium]|jgi:hypothetical protein|nr:dockerin type I domain-containing protein [FCB group bacterium]